MSYQTAATFYSTEQKKGSFWRMSWSFFSI